MTAVVTSPLPDVAIPAVPLHRHVLDAAAVDPDRVALIDAGTGERLARGELHRRVHASAAGLVADGVGPGDVVGLVTPNRPGFVVALLAGLATGAAVAPVNPRLAPAELGALLGAVGAGRVVAAGDVCERLGEAGVRPEQVLTLDPVPGLRRLDDLATGRDDTGAALPQVDPRSVALLPSSSGTTGRATPVRLTHRAVVANVKQTRVGWRLGPHDVQAALLPFFHIYGLSMVLLSGLRAGSTLVTVPGFEPTRYLATLAEHRVTRAYLVPPMVHALASSASPVGGAEGPDLSALTHVLCGAAPVDVGALERAEQVLGCRIRQGYGLTEAGGTHQVFDDDFACTPAGTVGHLSPGTQARVVESGTSTDVARGEPGELLLREPQLMSGYLGDPEADERAFVDGWLQTGDLVRVDDDGRFWVLDRLKEMVKCHGFAVAPAEVEAVLCSHPAVRDAAVVGAPDERAGELPVAFVSVHRPVEPDELVSWVGERVSHHKRVHAVTFVDEVPRSPAGKLLRRVLRDTAAERRHRPAVTP